MQNLNPCQIKFKNSHALTRGFRVVRALKIKMSAAVWCPYVLSGGDSCAS